MQITLCHKTKNRMFFLKNRYVENLLHFAHFFELSSFFETFIIDFSISLGVGCGREGSFNSEILFANTEK